MSGHIDAVILLVDLGADICAEDQTGQATLEKPVALLNIRLSLAATQALI